MTLSDKTISVLLGLAAFSLVGCGSTDGLHARYTQPRVEGRVVDADSGEAIELVVVHRNPPTQRTSPGDMPHAAELQEHRDAAYTDENGRFSFGSEKNLNFGGDRTWSALTLQLAHPDYETLRTNFVNRTDIREDGEPILRTGDIELQRQTNSDPDS